MLEFRDLSRAVAGYWIPTGAGATIVLAARLSRRGRKCTLSHELIHDERGIAFTQDTPIGLVAKEEAWVERTSARRLVPPTELVELVRRMIDLEEPVTVPLVADEFDVTDEVARYSLALLRSAS